MQDYKREKSRNCNNWYVTKSYKNRHVVVYTCRKCDNWVGGTYERQAQNGGRHG